MSDQPILRRAGSATPGGYVTTSPQLKTGGVTRSCGKCGRFGAQTTPGAWRQHKLFGWVCAEHMAKKDAA